MKLNKKGFTLIELLAVIVILAILMVVASANINGFISRSRKNTLAIEGNEAVNVTKTAYNFAIIDGKIGADGACFSLKYLYNNDYFDKGSGTDNYTGSVLVTPNTTKTSYTYKFWISNNVYKIENAAWGANGESAIAGGPASNDCGGAGKATPSKTGEVKLFN